MAKKSMKKRTAKRGAVTPAGRGKLPERALGPAADEFGKELAPLGKELGEVSLKVGRMLLLPIKGLVGGLERIGAWLGAAVTRRLINVPEEKVVPPSARIAVPAVQALVYSMDDEFIREMFANLLATDMNADTKMSAHPAFVEIIKEMTPNDARVFQKIVEAAQIRFKVALRGGSTLRMREVYFSLKLEGLDRHLIAYSLDNLARLALIEFRVNEGPDRPELEEQVKADWAFLDDMARAFGEDPNRMESMGFTERPIVAIQRSGIYSTGFGIEFWKACMDEKK
jgi:hypothetical protein